MTYEISGVFYVYYGSNKNKHSKDYVPTGADIRFRERMDDDIAGLCSVPESKPKKEHGSKIRSTESKSIINFF